MTKLSEMIVAPRKVSFEESLKFANIQMKIENPSIDEEVLKAALAMLVEHADTLNLLK